MRPPDPATVEAALDEVRRSLAEENERAQHLDSKASQLLAFVGVVFTLTATLGGSALNEVSLGSDRRLAGWLFVIALATLIASALLAVAAFRPMGYLGLDEDELEAFGHAPRIYDPRWQLQGDIMLGLVGPLRRARVQNDSKARWVKWAGRVGALALLLTSAEAVIVGLHSTRILNGSGDDKTRKSRTFGRMPPIPAPAVRAFSGFAAGATYDRLGQSEDGVPDRAETAAESPAGAAGTAAAFDAVQACSKSSP